MAIINNIDLGVLPTWQVPISTRSGAAWGTEVGSIAIEGGQTIIWSRAGTVRERTETVWIIANSSAAVLTLVRQLLELAGNPSLNPVYIQWASGGGNIVPDSEDGWYLLKSVTPTLEISADGIVPVVISAQYIAPGLGAKPVGIAFTGGSGQTAGYTGLGTPWLAYPINAASIPG